LVPLFPVIEARQLIALQALLALLQHLRRRVALKRLAQDQRNALANLREGNRRADIEQVLIEKKPFILRCMLDCIKKRQGRIVIWNRFTLSVSIT
jgi:hypothetical protein